VNSTVKVVPLERVNSPLLAVAVGEVTTGKLPTSLLGLDSQTAGALSRLIESGDFTGKRDQTVTVYPPKRPSRVLLIGLGPHGEITRGAMRRVAAMAGRKAIELGVESMAFHVAPESHGGVAPHALGQTIVEGVVQGAWSFTDLKAVEKKTKLRALDIIAAREERSDIERGRRIGAATASGHVLARNLQVLPGNVCTPAYLSDIARRLAKGYGFKLTVLGREQIAKAGMGGLLAVAQGSKQEPQFIVLEHRAAGRHAPLCFVGKGVTFDSGGISIKPAEHMEEMKYDMSGAAAVLGLFEVLGQLKPKVNVVGLIPATGDQAGRHRAGLARQDDRSRQYRRRGPPDPLRRAGLRAALQARVRHRCGNVDRRGGHRPGASRHGTHGQRRSPARGSPACG